MKIQRIKKITIAVSIALSPLSVVAQFQAVEELSVVDGNNGFVFHGIAATDFTGSHVSRAGDFNGDGIDDIIIGGVLADTNGLSNNGSSYVIFGTANGFPTEFELSDLDGNNGLAIHGIANSDNSGSSVSSLGDVNGDGIDDIIIGAPGVDTNANYSGASYVVFGKNTFPASLNLSSLDGSNGFAINGTLEFDNSGGSVSSSGDFNNDGINDIFLSAHPADPNGLSSSGSSYVVFGIQDNQNFPHPFELSTLNGTNGVAINGVAQNDHAGISISAAGDVNNDGIDDIIIGAFRAGFAGSSYVLYGKNTFSNPIELSTLTGINSSGFKIVGNLSNSRFGSSVSDAGDVNGDGIDDVIIGANRAGANGLATSGASYIVFGKSTFDSPLDVGSLDGTNGFTVYGSAQADELGNSVSSAGDVNGDGIEDIVIGAFQVDATIGDIGSCYVIFGSKNSFSPSFDLTSLDGYNGFTLIGEGSDDKVCKHVSDAGDVNGDGLDDLIIGTYQIDPNGINSGGGYVVFGNDKIFVDGFE